MNEIHSEKQYISNLFRESFSALKSKKIVLYGLAYGTEIIINECPEFNIIGLMDGFQKSGSMYGKPILSEQEAVRLKTDIIIIIARANSTKIIKKRIEKYCKDNAIQMFDMYGDKLNGEEEEFNANNPYFTVDYDKLIEELNSHEVVSFDIFDTLLIRKVLYPNDVFRNIERITRVKGFAQNRIEAEREANRRYKTPNIDQIYDIIIELGTNKENAISCKSQELEYEGRCLIPRNDMVKAFRHAIDAGKRVYIISDMYLPKNILSEILNNAGIYGYRDLLVSCEYKKTKASGLLGEVPEIHESWLHIGDSLDADIIPAQQLGIDAFRIYSPVDMVDISPYKNILSTYKSENESEIVGIIISKVFNSPFALHQYSGRANINNGHDFGYAFLGPIFSAFVLWLLNRCKDEDIQCLLLTARDGYLLKKLLDILQKDYDSISLPNYLYFYTSRSAAVSATISNEKELKYAAEIAFSGQPEQLLRERFLLREEKIKKHIDGESVVDYVFRHKNEIFQRSKELRKNYLKYIDSTEIFGYSSIGMIDHVSSGTCQMCLEDLIQRKLSGFYFIHYNDEYEPKQRLKVEGYFDDGFLSGLTSYYSKNYLPVESIIVSNEPTLKCFDENGKPIFMEEKRTNEELQYVEMTQGGIIDFWKDFLNCTGCNMENIRSSFADAIYGLIRKSYTKIDNCVLAEVVSRNEYCGTDYKMDWMFE